MQINPNAEIDIQFIGIEKTPVLIVDNILINYSELIDTAVNTTNFRIINSSMYPGVRAILPKDYVLQILRALAEPINKIYAIPKSKQLRPLGAYYSLVSIPASNLHPLQMKPHFDSDEPWYFAMIHYLNPNPHGGTGFFRHKPTGYECITKDRKNNYIELIKGSTTNNSEENVGYVNQTNSEYELIHSVDYNPNRLVFYPGNILHSGLINDEIDISDSPQSGRLTANMFIHFT
ncbi:DUF6445 family protein [Aliiglaciecola lipolytica]|uniref:Phytanoyl-CoA dioxygenase n=1 Tax=Aliiglaciecola lipolytica E3 TaxID=1127673 RepID=K6YVP9_9ALTE|nr:DUF6445 family protein [Aliiglaciecola lipolytica]GAC15305.1 hypothetical protein GLIP_2683 [Aliiglaciecola lipolytica E3]